METLTLIVQRAESFFDYWEQLPALDWAEAYQTALPRVRDAKTRAAYYQELSAFVAQLQDGHSGILWPTLQAANYDAVASFPFQLSYLEGKFVVGAVREGAKDLPVGAEVTTIDGLPTEAWLEERFGGWTGLQTPGARQELLGQLAQLSWNRWEKLTLEGVDPAGKTFSQSVSAMGGRPDGKWTQLAPEWGGGVPRLRRFTEYTSFSAVELEESVFAACFPDFQQPALGEEFSAWLEQVGPTAKGFLLDIRGNGGGNSLYGLAVLNQFCDVSDLAVLENSSRPGALAASRAASVDSGLFPYLAEELNTPAGQAALAEGRRILAGGEPQPESESGLEMKSGLDWETPKRRWNQPVAVLMDWNCASAGDNVAAYAAAAGERFTLVGTHSRGTLGDVGVFALPGGLFLQLSCVDTHWADGAPLINRGVSPDIWAEQTVDDARNGVDTALQAAWALLVKG